MGVEPKTDLVVNEKVIPESVNAGSNSKSKKQNLINSSTVKLSKQGVIFLGTSCGGKNNPPHFL